ncbi:MAG: xylose isomerase, partial [Cryobacterium sp.]
PVIGRPALRPTVGHALAFIGTLQRPDLVGVNPVVGQEQTAGQNATAAVALALDHGKLAHLSLSGQRGLAFGHGDLHSAFSLVDLLEHGGPQGGPAYDGPRHFDFTPSRTEDMSGVWLAAAANMRNYLLLKVRVAAYRADPEVQEALAAARVPELDRPTLDAGEHYDALLSDRSAWEDFAPHGYFGGRGSGSARLHQLALEHLLGAR